MQIVLRPATIADTPYLLELEEVCMRQYAEDLWGIWRPSEKPENLDLTSHELVQQDCRKVGCVATTWNSDHLSSRSSTSHPVSRVKELAHMC